MNRVPTERRRAPTSGPAAPGRDRRTVGRSPSRRSGLRRADLPSMGRPRVRQFRSGVRASPGPDGIFMREARRSDAERSFRPRLRLTTRRSMRWSLRTKGQVIIVRIPITPTIVQLLAERTPPPPDTTQRRSPTRENTRGGRMEIWVARVATVQARLAGRWVPRREQVLRGSSFERLDPMTPDA